VERKGFAFFVDLDYENLPDFCTHCNIVGHYVGICKNLQNHENVIKNTETKQKAKNKVEKKYVQTVASLEQNKVTEVVDVEVSVLPVEGCKSHPVIVADGIGESSKATPNNLQEARVDDLVQQNKFNILADVEVENVNDVNSDKSIGGEDMNTENVPEDTFEEVEENIDNSSSTDDFVDATQFQKDDTIAVDQHEVSTPVRVQNDMRFLKESWATMVDLEEQEAAIAGTSLVDAQKKDDGFQIQMSKHQKKAQKRTTISSKDSYATRSKVSSKPFK
jgi:hypothetical protein